MIASMRPPGEKKRGGTEALRARVIESVRSRFNEAPREKRGGTTMIFLPAPGASMLQ